MRTSHSGDRLGGPLAPPAPDVYDALDRPTERPARRPRPIRSWRPRTWAVLVALVAFAAGVSIDATVLHLGGHSPSTSVVIGQRVIRENPPPRPATRTPPPSASPSLTWGVPILIDATAPIESVSCTSNAFCAAVDGRGQAVIYQGGHWSPPERIDGTTQINSVSCTSSSWCAAVDQAGNFAYYDGSDWSRPQRIDSSTFPELTSISCSSSTFCAAVDGKGNGLVYDGARWSPPQQADPQGATSPVSRDVPTVSCPANDSCVGVDPEGDGFFYLDGSWQVATNGGASTGTPSIKYPNTISCASVTFCMATDNLGEVVGYDGTQWSLPVTVDPSNYIPALSCPSTTLCVGIDSLLPAGFNPGSGEASGQVLTYNGVTWSGPHQIDEAGIVSSISCPDEDFCIAVDAAGHAIIGANPPTGSTP